MLRRVDEHDPVLIEQLPVPFDEDCEVTAILEGEPRAAIGEDVGSHRGRGVQCRPHPRARFLVPRALVRLDIDASRLPIPKLRRVRPLPLRPARDTNGAFAASIFLSASSTSFPPATFAGSDFGPMITKSLYMTSL